MLITNEQKQKTQETLQLFNYYENYRRDYRETALDNYKDLVGYKKQLDEDDPRSNLHIPRVYQIVDTIRSRLVMAFFKREPYFEFLPSPTRQNMYSKQSAEEKAKVASNIVDQQLNRNNIVSKFYDFVTSFLTFPLGIMSVGWRYEEKMIRRRVPEPEIQNTRFGYYKTGNYVYVPYEQKEVAFDDNHIGNVNFFDFWPDPRATDISNARGVFHREFLTWEEVVDRIEFYRKLNEGTIYQTQRDDLGNAQSLESGRSILKNAVEQSDGDEYDVYSNLDDRKENKNELYEFMHYWEPDKHKIIINRQQIVYEGPSPYWRHGELPFVTASFERLPNQMMGQGAIDFLHDLQQEENAIHNQRSDNVNMILNKMWKVKRTADIDESQLISQPHGIIHVDEPDDIEPIEFNDVVASSFQQQNIISQIMENTLGTPPIMRGAEGRGSSTATEVMKQTTNAGMRFDVKIRLYNELGLQRLAYLMDMNNQQFISDERIIKMKQEGVEQWRAVEPREIIGEFDYRPATPSIDPGANKQVRREQMTMLMQTLLNMQIPYVDYYKLIKEWIEEFDIPNPESFLLPKDQAREIMKQMMLQQQKEEQGKDSKGKANNNQPTMAQQQVNANYGKKRSGSPQQHGPTQERKSGQVR